MTLESLLAGGLACFSLGVNIKPDNNYWKSVYRKRGLAFNKSQKQSKSYKRLLKLDRLISRKNKKTENKKRSNFINRLRENYKQPRRWARKHNRKS